MDSSSGFSARVRGIKISETKAMPMRAAAIGGCVSLGQGIPSFAAPKHLVQAVCQALANDASAGKYSLQPGMPALRQAVGTLLMQEKGLAADPESEIAITVGAMEALAMAMLTLVERGDEVILPAPYYPSHAEQVSLAEGVPVFAPLRSDWSLDPEAIERAVTFRTKAIILSSPHNPTGAVFREEDLRAAAALADKRNLYVICDDTYDFLSYDRPAFSVAALPELRERLVAVGSFSKRFALTGWRVGFTFAPKPIMDQMLKIHDAVAICAPTPSQIAALAALSGPQEVFAGFRDALKQRRDLTCESLDALAEHFSYVRPAGAFYVMAKARFPIADSMDLALRLLQEARVITIPGQAFGPGAEGHVRMSFGGEETEIAEAFRRIGAWVEKGC